MHYLIGTERLVIRSFTLNDLDVLAGIHADPETMQFMDKGHTESREQVQNFLQRNSRWQPAHQLGEWAIEHKITHQLIGRCGIVPCDILGTSEIEFGYLIARSEWGQGYATETTWTLVYYALHILKIPRLIAMTHPQNQRSIRVIEKCGLAFEQEVQLPKGKRLIFAIHRSLRHA